MDTNATINTDDSIYNFLDVKAEPNEIFYSTQAHYMSSECSHPTRENFTEGEYKNEPPSSPASTFISIKDENFISLPMLETFFTNHNISKINNDNFIPLSISSETEMNVATKLEITVLKNVPCRIEEKNSTNVETYKKVTNHKCDEMRYEIVNQIDVTAHKRDVFKSRNEFSQQKTCRTVETNHKCDACLKSFKLRKELARHMKCHNDERNHKCDHCTKSYKRRSDVVKHMKSHNDEKNFKCDSCAKTFKSRYEVVNHMKYHTDERNHKCDVCAKSFKTRSNLVDHVKCHTGEKDKMCDICGKSFKMKHQLLKHVKCHSDERNYGCKICGKRFKTRGTLSIHLSYHTVERNHKCGVCSKSFKASRDVAKHMKCHTDERNYKCDVCAKSYKRKNDLVVHMKRHVEKRKKCNIGSENFKERDFADTGESFEWGPSGKDFVQQQNCKIMSNYIEIGSEDSLQKLPYNINSCDDGARSQNLSIKEENFDIDIACDAMKNNYSTTTGTYFRSGPVQVKSEPAEIVHQSQTIKLEDTIFLVRQSTSVE